MPASIFAGSKVKTLKDTLTLNGKSDIISSTVDPTASAVDAPIGSLLINQTSGKLYRKLDAGSSVNWEEVGAGVGGINYILNPSAEVNTTGWATYADAAGTAPVDGTGGSPNVTWTRSTTSPLRGVADFNFAKDAANRQGQGVSYDFTIDEADKAKVLSVTFDYEVLSGTYADGDLTVYLIADPAGTPVVIQPAGYTVLSATSGTTMRQRATFQTQATGTSYRLCFHVASTSASAYTLAIDNVVVGPQQTVQGAAISDWQSYTPTWTTSSNPQPSIGNGSINGKYRRVGDSIEISIGLVAGTTTTFGNGTFLFGYPPGVTFDSTKLESISTIPICGVAQGNAGANTQIGSLEANPTYFTIRLALNSGQAQWGTLYPTTWANGNRLTIFGTIPVVGLSSNTVMSQDTDTRVVAARYGVSGTRTPTTSKAVNYDSKVFDTHGAVTTVSGDVAGWKFTAPVSGFYEVSITSAVTSGATTNSIFIYLNGVQNIALSTVADLNLHSGSGVVEMKSGEYIDIRSDGTPTLNSNSVFNSISIRRLSGPATIAASEKLVCSYNTSTSVIAGSGTWSQVTYTNKVVDTHAIYNTSTGVATIPVSGVYRITHQMRSKNALIAGQYLSVHFTKNGTSFNENLTFAIRAGAASMLSDTSGPAIWVGTLLAGDLIRFSMDSNSASNGPTTVAAEQVGNTFTIQLI